MRASAQITLNIRRTGGESKHGLASTRIAEDREEVLNCQRSLVTEGVSRVCLQSKGQGGNKNELDTKKVM